MLTSKLNKANIIFKYVKENNIKHITLNLSDYENEDFSLKLIQTEVNFGAKLNISIHPKHNILIKQLEVAFEYPIKEDDKIFSNGYQSWTESRELAVTESIKGPSWQNNILDKKYHFKPYGDYHFTDYSNKAGEFHGYTFAYIIDKKQKLSFIGSLSEKEGYTVLKINATNNQFTIKKDCENLMINSPYKAFELVALQGEYDAVFDAYFFLMKIDSLKVKPTTGWTSWYHYYETITEEIIVENLNSYIKNNIPIDIFQIDDGYQHAVGDWLETNQKFPNGMKPIVDKVHTAGYKVGLWLAPFVCETKSEVYKNHQDWLLKDEKGKNVCTGGNWSIQWALNIENNEVRDYLRQVFKKVFDDWGFDMVKLDFLYAACMLPMNNKTRGQIMCESMEFLRELIGERMILGCGVPLGPSFGLVDYCRIGCDLDLYWDRPTYRFALLRERLSSQSSMYNAIGRRGIDGKGFFNDPDVFLLRSNNIHMNMEEKNTIFYVNHTFGSLVFTSDNLNEYSTEEMQKYLSAFPYLPKKIISLKHDNQLYETYFKIGDIAYYMLVNLNNIACKKQLPEGTFFLNNNGKEEWHKGNEYVQIEAHSTRCFLKISETDYALAGSNVSMFPSSEVESWSVDDNKISIKLHQHLLKKGNLYFKVPASASEVMINGESIKAYEINGINLIKYSI